MDQPSGEYYLESGNATLTVKFYARPSAETIIFLHGGPGVPDEFTEVREFLMEHMQVITFDQRGIGFTGGKRCSFSMADYISDINNIAAYFKIRKFHLFGHSWGGLYAQIYASEYPQRIASLFLCSPVAGTGKLWNMAEREVFLYNRKRSTFREWILMGMNTLLGILGSKKAYRRLFRQIIINYHKGYNVPPPDPEKLAKINGRTGIETRKTIKKYHLSGTFGETPYPVMITYGQYDAYSKSQVFVPERFPFASIATIPASGHTPWKHNPEEFNKVLHYFYFERH